MLKRQTTGSVVCPNCGRLVGVLDARCYQCGRPRPGLWGYGPAIRQLTGNLSFADIVTGGCVIMLLATLLYDVEGITSHGILSLFAPSTISSFVFGASGGIPVFAMGRWWTVLSASFLHYGVIHIAFNLYYLRMLLPGTERIFGIGRTIIIYTVASITGFGLTSLARFLFASGAWVDFGPINGGIFSAGASASLCGLLGALWIYSRMSGNSMMSRQLGQAALFILAIGFLLGGIDNLAHIGGFFGGVLAAKSLKPLEDENVYHMAGGLLCLLAFAVSIAASIFFGLEQRSLLVAYWNTYQELWKYGPP